jgi:putative RNA 2'-phosphotransferase
LVEHTARVCGVRFPYPIEFCEVDADVSQKVFENAKVEVWTIPLRHRVPCSGWLFREKPRPRNILKEKIEEYALHFSLIPGIKAGADLLLFSDGRRVLHEPGTAIPENAVLISNEELTLPPPPPRAYAFCSDTAPADAVAEAVRGVDLLYHAATFTDEHTEEALISFHSTAAQAADIARRAGAGRLLLGHFSGRYADETAHLEQARAVFPETYAAEEGVRWEAGSVELGQPVRSEDTEIQQDVKVVEAPAGKQDVLLSKFLSRVLRHQPGEIGLVLDANGWADVRELMEKARKKRFHFDLEILQRIVATNSKQRFAFNEDQTRIRANQGHTIDIDLGLEPQTPPDVLYHGTAVQNLEIIRKTGLKSMKRQHVHLSLDTKTAVQVGSRHGKAVVLTIETGKMAAQGYVFYVSANGVWLTEEVPAEFIVWG